MRSSSESRSNRVHTSVSFAHQSVLLTVYHYLDFYRHAVVAQALFLRNPLERRVYERDFVLSVYIFVLENLINLVG